LCVGSRDYMELALPGGHVGVFVGGKSQGLLGSGIANWLAERDEAPTEKKEKKKSNRPRKTRSQ
jgi:Na+/glutamate symporter